MYLADYHTHSTCSPDGRNTMTEMAQAAVAAGLDELCITDHVDVLSWLGEPVRSHDWERARGQYAAARYELGASMQIKLGAELGQATANLARANRFLDDAPDLDFVIGSLHNTAEKYGHKDFCVLDNRDEAFCRETIGAYLEEMLELAQWGRFSVIGHMTLPLRYMNENLGLHMSYDGFEDRCAEIFKTIIPKGVGIELNTNRGKMPLPDEKLLRQYRSLGGEIITLGSDAHTPEYVGCQIENRAQLLKDCGFAYYCTFEKMQPIFHKL